MRFEIVITWSNNLSFFLSSSTSETEVYSSIVPRPESLDIKVDALLPFSSAVDFGMRLQILNLEFKKFKLLKLKSKTNTNLWDVYVRLVMRWCWSWNSCSPLWGRPWPWQNWPHRVCWRLVYHACRRADDFTLNRLWQCTTVITNVKVLFVTLWFGTFFWGITFSCYNFESKKRSKNEN